MTTETERVQQAVLYLRTDAMGSVDLQRSGCQRITELYGIAIIREYVDLDRPARFERQTKLQQLLDDLEERRDAAFVVIYDYARIARDMNQLNEVIRRIHGCGAEIATFTGMHAAHRYIEEQQLNAKEEG